MNTVIKSCLILALTAWLGACTAKPLRDVGTEPIAQPTEQALTKMRAPRVIPKSTPRVRFYQEPRPQDRLEEFYPRTEKSIKARQSKKSRRTKPGDISLEFENANLNEVVRAILGDILKRNFVIDPNVAGKVTLTTDRPLREDELIPTLEAILASQGAKLLVSSGVYRITRSTTSSALAGGGIGIGDKATPADGNLRIFPLDFITAKGMAKILKPLLPKDAILHADTKRNILLIAGSGTELRLAASTVEIFDINQMTDQNVLMISMENADARIIVSELQTIFGADGETGGSAELVKFIPIDRLNTILVMSAQQAYIEKARDWIYRLDRNQNPTERRLFVYYVQNGRASKLAKGLREIVGNISDGAERETPTQGAAGAAVNSANTSARARVASAGGAGILGEGVKISVDDEHNALLISATPKDFMLIDNVLAKLDLPQLQVMIEVTIFEVVLGDELRYGIQYAISNGGLGITSDGTIGLTRDTTTATSNNIFSPIISPLLPGFSFTIEGASRSRLIIDALSDITEVKVLSSPNILVLNNETARLLVGDEVPIVTQTTTSAVTDNPLIVNTVEYRNTGVSLEVTPQVNASGMVRLEIVQNVSDVTVTTTSTIDSPTIQNRSVISTILVKSGETVMLGGLIREQSTSRDTGLPLLHDLPLIGALFGQKTNLASRTELVVMIRPVIAATPADTQKITTDLKRKFQILLQHETLGIRQPRRLDPVDG